jgi:hypothetical protein
MYNIVQYRTVAYKYKHNTSVMTKVEREREKACKQQIES